MAHIFSVLSTVNGQLNIISKEYCGDGKARTLIKAPDFIPVIINRAIDNDPDNLINSEKNISIEKPILATTGDSYNPVYMCVVTNIKHPVIDTVPVIVDYKEDHGPGTAIILGIPKILFDEETETDSAAEILREIYFGLLDADANMHYSASPALIRLCNSTKIKIPTYDLTMAVVAIGCIYVNLKSWYDVDDEESSNGNKILPPSYALEAFTDDEIPTELKDKICHVLFKYCRTIGDMRDAVANGFLIREFLYGK